jgi:hypothetical protein
MLVRASENIVRSLGYERRGGDDRPGKGTAQRDSPKTTTERLPVLIFVPTLNTNRK